MIVTPVYPKRVKLLLLILFSFSLYAQEQEESRPKIPTFVDLSKIKVLAPEQVRLVKKSVYEALLAGKAFDLKINGGSKLKKSQKKDWLVISIGIKKSSIGFKANLELLSLKTKKRIKQLTQERIAKSKLQLTVRVMIYKLLYGKNFDEKQNIIIKNEVAPEIINFEQESEIVQVEEELEAEDSKEDVIASNLKSEIKEKQAIETPVVVPEEKKKKKKPKVAISNFDSPDIDLTYIAPPEIKKNTKRPPWLKEYDLRLNYILDQIQSEVVVKVSEDNQLLRMGGSFNFFPPDSKHFNSLSVDIEKIFSEDRAQKPINFRTKLTRNLNVYERRYFLGAGLGLSSENFTNVNEQGTGLASWNNQLLWLSIGGLFYFDHRNLTHSVDIGLSKALIGLTNLSIQGETVPLGGNKIEVNLSYNLYRNYFFTSGLSAQALSSTSGGLKYSQSQLYLGLMYR